MKNISLFLLTLPLSTIATLASLTIAVAQEVTPDGTVSTTVITPDGKNFNINDGTTRGTNLFHSFKEFSVPTGGSATFNNAANIQNIISRVTGGSVSTIDGLIRTLGKANLFLLNPAGIIFGPNASLNIGGSFLGSTANSFLFDNNFEFSATNPQAPPLLTINIPIGLRYRDNPQNITIQSTPTQYPTLEVPSGKTLALVGGNVSLNSPDLLAPGGRIELGGLSAPGTVGLNSDGSLSFPEGVQRGDVSLTNAAFVDVRAGGGGSIAVHARNLELSGTSFLRAGIQSGLGTPSAQAGDIKVDAKETVSLDGSSITNRVEEKGVGNAGGINITTNKLLLTNGAQLSTNTSGEGSAGSVFIKASNVSLEGNNTRISARVEDNATKAITSGNISITTDKLSLTDGAQLSTSIYGKGDAGSITINASNTVSFDGTDNDGNPSGAFSNVNAGGVGNGGEINITAGSLELTNGGEINAFVRSRSGTTPAGNGNAGNVKLNIRDGVTITGVSNNGTRSGIFSTVEAGGVGNAGGIDITTNKLLLTNGAQLSTNTSGEGSAGSVFIKASNVSLEGNNTRISARVEDNATKAITPGNISITADKLSLTDGAQLSTSTYGKGDAGSITINASNTVSFDGTDNDGNPSGAFSAVNSGAQGNAGGIDITTNKLLLTNGARLSTNTFGEGSAGSVFIKASNVSLEGDNTAIFARVGDNATKAITPGNISITTDKLSLTDGAQLSTSIYGKGDAGSITINASNTVSFDGTDNDGNPSGAFSAVNSGAQGNAGGIDITTNKLLLTNGAQLSTNTSGEGSAGSVFIKASNVSLEGDNTAIFARVGDNATKAITPGNISITTDKLSLTDGAQLSTSTYGKGDAGSITINANNTVSFDGTDNDGNPSGAFSNVNAGGVGNGGEINITAGSLELTNGGEINAFVRSRSGTTPAGNGNAGNVKLNIRDGVTITGVSNNGTRSGIFSSVGSGATGNAGSIDITARSLSLTNGARLSVNSANKDYSAGNITVTTAKDIRLDNQASIRAETRGGKGNIRLTARDLILRGNSDIVADATGSADGGNITINVPKGFILTTPRQDSDIIARASSGQGGTITIRTLGLFGIAERPAIEGNETNDIDTRSQFGLQGTVNIITPNIDPSKGLFELTETVIDPAQQIAQNVCIKGFGSSFTITGRGGIPTDPKKIISTDNVRVDLVKPAPSTVSSTSTTQKQPSQEPTVKKIIPARGWIFNEKGEVLLVGYDPTKTGVQRPQPAPTSSCAAVK